MRGSFAGLARYMGRRSVGDRSDQSAGEKLAAKQMRLFSAAAVSLALLALGNGASLAQSAPPLLGVIGQTSPLGPPFGATGNDVRGPASQNSPLPYSGVPTPGMAMPCAMANPGTSGLPTFDGGGFTPSVGTTMSGMPAGASSPAGATQIPCPTVSTSGITPTANGNVASTLTSAAATSGSVANTSPAAAPNSSPNTVVQGVAGLGASSLGTSALGTTGLGASTATSPSASAKTTLSTAASSSATSCANTSAAGMTTGGANTAGPTSRDETDLTGIVPDPAQILAGSLRSPVQSLGGTASTPAAPCPPGK
jgi:hypothetical protein